MPDTIANPRQAMWWRPTIGCALSWELVGLRGSAWACVAAAAVTASFQIARRSPNAAKTKRI